MTKSPEKHTETCSFCESQYKIQYDTEETSGFHKHCPFCGEEIDFEGNDFEVEFNDEPE